MEYDGNEDYPSLSISLSWLDLHWGYTSAVICVAILRVFVVKWGRMSGVASVNHQSCFKILLSWSRMKYFCVTLTAMTPQITFHILGVNQSVVLGYRDCVYILLIIWLLLNILGWACLCQTVLVFLFKVMLQHVLNVALSITKGVAPSLHACCLATFPRNVSKNFMSYWPKVEWN